MITNNMINDRKKPTDYTQKCPRYNAQTIVLHIFETHWFCHLLHGVWKMLLIIIVDETEQID